MRSAAIEEARKELRTIFIERSVIDHFTTVFDERLSEFLGQSVGRSSSRVTSVDVILHVVELATRIVSFRQGRATSGRTSWGSARFMMTIQRAVMSRSTVVRRPNLRRNRQRETKFEKGKKRTRYRSTCSSHPVEPSSSSS